jgi:ADYC domain
MRLLSCVVLTACALPAPDVDDVVARVLPPCDVDFCGTNSPLMAHYGTWEFNTKGVRNGQGFQVLGLGKGLGFYELVVSGSRIVGRDNTGKDVLTGSNLIGARIYLDLRGKQSAIEITDAGQIAEVVVPNRLLETYVLDWGAVVGHPLPGPMYAGATLESGSEPVLAKTQPVCPPPKWINGTYGSASEWDETINMGMAPFQSVVFEGDRFDPQGRTVAHLPQNDWFNIGCGAHTLAKLRLTRNTINTSPSWSHVQAALKMLGADYCNSGRSFTVPGEPLVWRDRIAMQFLHMNPKHELEARWDADGATCLSVPRLAITNNPAAASASATIWKDIEDECRDFANGKVLDKCTEPDPQIWDGELVTSANYD